MEYYGDTKPWRMGGEAVKVVDDNDHLGQIVSGKRQEAKNVDERLRKGRNSLFSMLGAAFHLKAYLVHLSKYTFSGPSTALSPNLVSPHFLSELTRCLHFPFFTGKH